MLKSVKFFSLRIFFCIFALLKNDKRFNNNAEKLNRQGRRKVAIIRETEIVGSNPTAATYLTYTKGRRKSGQLGHTVSMLILRNLRRFESSYVNYLGLNKCGVYLPLKDLFVRYQRKAQVGTNGAYGK